MKSPADAAKTKRRGFQFNLKIVFVAVTVASLPCGWVVYLRHGKDVRRSAERRIKELGGSVNGTDPHLILVPQSLGRPSRA